MARKVSSQLTRYTSAADEFRKRRFIGLQPGRVDLVDCTDLAWNGVRIIAFSSKSRNLSPESVVFQGAGVITPDGLPSLPSVDLMRGLGDGEPIYPCASSGLTSRPSVASDQVLSWAICNIKLY